MPQSILVDSHPCLYLCTDGHNMFCFVGVNSTNLFDSMSGIVVITSQHIATDINLLAPQTRPSRFIVPLIQPPLQQSSSY